MTRPEVSVVIRSFNRLDRLAEVLARCLAQRGCGFEVVIVEQTTRATDEERARFEETARDPRVRVLRFPPLGGACARNEGVRAARGEILLLLDDDDLPWGDDWMAKHLANYADPRCLGVAGRGWSTPNEAVPYRDPERAYQRCMTYSRVLKLPRSYLRIDRRKVGIQTLQGTNASLRRSAVERFGLWDETTRIQDEHSFFYRLLRGKRGDEYLVFDPQCVVLRGLDVPGGLEKRRVPAARVFTDQIVFVHAVIGRYFPWRVLALYPAYLVAAFVKTVTWVMEISYAHAGRKPLALAAVLVTAPVWWAKAVVRWLIRGRAPTPTLDADVDPRSTR